MHPAHRTNIACSCVYHVHSSGKWVSVCKISVLDSNRRSGQGGSPASLSRDWDFNSCWPRGVGVGGYQYAFRTTCLASTWTSVSE